MVLTMWPLDIRKQYSEILDQYHHSPVAREYTKIWAASVTAKRAGSTGPGSIPNSGVEGVGIYTPCHGHGNGGMGLSVHARD